MEYKSEIKIYIPSEDSLFLVDQVKKYSGNRALEIGFGSGIVLDVLSKNFDLVIGTEIDITVFQYRNEKYFKNNDIDNSQKKKLFLVCCDSVSPITNLKFDLIVSNPPYLPDDLDTKDTAIYGGKEGFETTLKFIRESTNLLNNHGKILMVVSSLIPVKEFELELERLRLMFKILDVKKLFFEELFIYEIKQK